MHVGGVADAADELTHHAQAAAVRDAALLWGEIAGDQAQQDRLARPVRADQGRRGGIADPERDVVEQPPAVRQQMADVRDLDMAHADKSGKSLCGRAIRFLSVIRDTTCCAATITTRWGTCAPPRLDWLPGRTALRRLAYARRGCR